MNSTPPRFVVLAILDGWGFAPKGPGNAIALASTPTMDRLVASYPHTELEASGEAVGLPRKEDGNTETGHLNIGAGRIIYQDLERINMSVADGTFFENEVLIKAIQHAKTNQSNLHYMGLVGAGGVHSDIHHLYALLQLAAKHSFDRLYLHLFTDGRDSAPTSAKTYVAEIKKVILKEKVGVIASLMGRYWAMDRDQRWERTQVAYQALTSGKGVLVDSPEEAIDMSYAEGKTDEFIAPSLVKDDSGKPVVTIKDNDAIVFFNFRIDRPRQLSKAFVFDNFSEADTVSDFDPHATKYEQSHTRERVPAETFDRGPKLKNLFFATMTQYGKPLVEAGAHVAFPPLPVTNPLGKIISERGLKQLRITESEKERFVTFYFNGLHEEAFAQEERIIIPSPSVPTYDQKPEMSSDEMTSRLLTELQSFTYSLVVANYPSPDMVGHTGNIGPAVKAVEAVDKHLGQLVNFVHAYDGMLIVTADHGNVEEMINMRTGEIDTEHSESKVPFIAVSKRLLGNPKALTPGILADIAPTILSVLNIPIPEEMTGRNLLQGVWN